MIRQLIVRWLNWALAKLDPKRQQLSISTDVLSQAAALATGHQPTERVVVTPAEPIRFRRRTYAQEQMEWEWAHNKRAREMVERARAGFI